MKVNVLQESLARDWDCFTGRFATQTLPVLSTCWWQATRAVCACRPQFGTRITAGSGQDRRGRLDHVPARTSLTWWERAQEQVNSAWQPPPDPDVRCGASNTDIKCIDAQEFRVACAEMEGAILLNVATSKT